MKMSAAPRKIASGPPSDRPITTWQFAFVYLRTSALARRCTCAIRAYVCGKMMKWGPQFDLYGPIRAHDSQLRIAAVDLQGQEGRKKEKEKERKFARLALRPPFPAPAAAASLDTSRSSYSERKVARE